MATRCEAEKGVTLIQSCSDGTSNTESANRCGVRHTNRRRRKWTFRNIGSSSILLILTWVFIVQCSLSLLLSSESTQEKAQWEQLTGFVGVSTLICIIIPIVSLLAEVVFGRYKLVSISIKIMWLLYIATSAISVCEGIVPAAKTALNILKVALAVPQFMLQGGFIACAVPLGLDQITTGTHTNISSFILWFCWAYSSGITISLIVASVLYTNFQASEVSMIMSLLPVLLLSVVWTFTSTTNW